MSPSPSFHDHHAKPNNNTTSMLCPPPLKVSKDSHTIKKSSSSTLSSPPSSSCSFSSSASSLAVAGPAKPPQQRHPVIIYTHSPKIIHTHPRDFMALVQKLTGLSHSSLDQAPRAKQEEGKLSSEDENNKSRMKIVGNDDNESSSVITEENNCGNNSSIGDGQVNSCFVPPIFEPPNPYITNIPVFTPNSADFLCANQPFYNNYTDSLFFSTPNNMMMRTSISSSPSTLEGINEFREY
ncbi:hypothetical protein RCOM_1158870 [Ricinus communis]|uniref:VQ domain-containing protein n=1 Tax=Ricinus communis TaxID=3988 RepID=B9T1N8_RICCO|nr:hypothetical protein RCOM_1158870 [Ricinus communis]|eukprot:XP_002532157.1 VQ motif-containing protein 20 [Ricinus communis]